MTDKRRKQLESLSLQDLEYLSIEGQRIWNRLTTAYQEVGIIGSDSGESNPETDYYFTMMWDSDTILKEKKEAIFGEAPETKKTDIQDGKLWSYFTGLNNRNEKS
jgi:hypothetical protein